MFIRSSGAGAFGRAHGIAVDGLLRIGGRVIHAGSAAWIGRNSEVLRSCWIHHGAAGSSRASGQVRIEGGVGGGCNRTIAHRGICGRCIAFVVMLLLKYAPCKAEHRNGNSDAGYGIKSVGFHGFDLKHL